ncbi:hypothetical protein DPV78_003556 [Talaromyces pinophilus]|nr:hypothetical protein DPV78_003556 [Talaromyces pinophilus]
MVPDRRGRRLIRHHVMKGKNQKRAVTRPSTPKSWINRDNDVSESPTRLCPQLNVSPSLVGFDDRIESHMLQDAFKFINVMQQAMYPIENCIDTREDDRRWFEDLVHDPEYAQTVCISARAYFDTIRSITLQSTAIRQMNRGIAMLRRKLSDVDMLVTDSMIFLVLALAMISEVFNEFDAAEKHLHGLYQLIELHGGMNTLSRKQVLQVKCCRFDLRFALRTGSKPLFFPRNDYSWEPYLAKSKRLAISPQLDALFQTIDERLTNVWLDLRELTTAVDLAHQTRRRLSPMLFQETLLSVLYRLERLAFDAQSRNEILRKAKLVFATTTFLYTGLISMHHLDLVRDLREYFDSSDLYSNQQSLELCLWIIYVVGPGLDVSHDRTWLCWRMLQISRALNLHSWSESRKLLKNCLWADIVRNQAGENFFNEAWRYSTHDGPS